MKQLVLATTNQGKVREFARLLNEPRIVVVGMRELVPPGFEVEETGTTFAANAWLKAEAVCKATGLPALADDSGLEVDALLGRPGVYSARYAGASATDQQNNELLLRELEGIAPHQRTARFVCVLALAVPSGAAVPTGAGLRRVAETRGCIEGHILSGGRGKDGFGYDPLFEPLEFPGKTTAELGGAEKDAISHRGQAARSMLRELSSWLDLE